MKALVVATDGFEDSEFSYPYYRLQEDSWEVDVATPDGDAVEGEYGYTFDADHAIDERSPSAFADEYDLLVVPGGDSPEALRTEAPEAADVVASFDEHDVPIAAICHGAQLLISADVLEGRRATGYWTLEVDIQNAGAEYVDEAVVADGNLVTSRVPDDLPAFMDRALDRVDQAEQAERGEPAVPA
ncbi:type 1 glutamine amidotransferase domain-containing protein [Halarchaeum sp. P4]|uniref:type 1 glutamine amidotransferase domain-containing protein n=1 Tax=Halarchaeum sp. P4 TaxID=3421639 RepID=UPI003EBECC1A